MNKEIKALCRLKEHLEIAQSWDWEIGKMHYIDGFVAALNMLSDKHYTFAGTRIYEVDEDGVWTEIGWEDGNE